MVQDLPANAELTVIPSIWSAVIVEAINLDAVR